MLVSLENLPTFSFLELSDGNQIQDGYHLGRVAELIIERNLPLVTPISCRKNQIN
jgi:hypothetical protein